MFDELAPSPQDAARPWADDQVHGRIRVFLEREAEMLDNRWYKDWLDLVDEEFVYQIPVPVTPDNPAAPHYAVDGLIVDETRETLAEHWFRRLEPDMWEIAWGEVPPVRFRHFVCDVRVRILDETRYDVRSNVLVTAVRQSDQPTLMPVERFDVIAEGDSGLRLRSRFAVPETTVLEFAQLRAIL